MHDEEEDRRCDRIGVLSHDCQEQDEEEISLRSHGSERQAGMRQKEPNKRNSQGKKEENNDDEPCFLSKSRKSKEKQGKARESCLLFHLL